MGRDREGKGGVRVIFITVSVFIRVGKEYCKIVI